MIQHCAGCSKSYIANSETFEGIQSLYVCPGIPPCEACAEKDEKIAALTDEKWNLARLLDKRNHEWQQANAEIARLRALVADLKDELQTWQQATGMAH